MTTVLRYTGDDEGVPFVMGVPARNLTDDDLEQLVGGRYGNDRGTIKRRLIKTGIYSESKPAASSAGSTKET
ncbi:MAG: hypothetical protein M3N43_14715 [Actinomycetota bacterium]|nr:hypothetical protein [Actinomycetota bacterium]